MSLHSQNTQLSRVVYTYVVKSSIFPLKETLALLLQKSSKHQSVWVQIQKYFPIKKRLPLDWIIHTFFCLLQTQRHDLSLCLRLSRTDSRLPRFLLMHVVLASVTRHTHATDAETMTSFTNVCVAPSLMPDKVASANALSRKSIKTPRRHKS